MLLPTHLTHKMCLPSPHNAFGWHPLSPHARCYSVPRRPVLHLALPLRTHGTAGGTGRAPAPLISSTCLFVHVAQRLAPVAASFTRIFLHPPTPAHTSGWIPAEHASGVLLLLPHPPLLSPANDCSHFWLEPSRTRPRRTAAATAPATHSPQAHCSCYRTCYSLTPHQNNCLHLCLRAQQNTPHAYCSCYRICCYHSHRTGTTAHTSGWGPAEHTRGVLPWLPRLLLTHTAPAAPKPHHRVN